jgi:hypothetical protein
MSCPIGKKKETKYAIYNFYIQRIPPYSAFWAENRKCFQNAKMGMSSIDYKFSTSGTDEDSKVTQYGPSTAFSCTAKK